MQHLNRRSLILALTSVSLVACHKTELVLNANTPLANELDMSGVKDIAKSYLSATQDNLAYIDIKQLFKMGDVNLEAIKVAMKADYISQRIFMHQGWYLSHTEGKLFALLARDSSTET